jgi:hypothetical protein
MGELQSAYIIFILKHGETDSLEDVDTEGEQN